ncbi:MAG: glycosyltransferase family 2 protein [Candidatus Hodarchaeota archaeon]
MICCIIPAYNEEASIGSLIKETGKYVDQIIVVDDGSLDATARNALKAGAIVISHPNNRGKGEALKTGFIKAISLDADVVITLDGDGQHSPTEILKFLKVLEQENADIVVGSRFLKDVTVGRKMPSQRIISNTLTTNILRVFFGIPLTDSQSGFRAFKGEALKKLGYVDSRFAAETEILIDAHKKGFKIKEVDIKTRYGTEKSKIKPLNDTIRWIQRVLIKKIQG